MVILIYINGILDTLNFKKKFTNVILKEIILIYVRTLKIDPKVMNTVWIYPVDIVIFFIFQI